MSDITNTTIQTIGRVTVKGEIKAVTGLRIGGSNTAVSIGGASPVIRSALTNEPYIPGSSLKGKMRALLERALGLPLEPVVGQSDPERLNQRKIHFCNNKDDYPGCPICNIFGISSAQQIVNWPTRLVVRDCALTEKTKNDLELRETDMPLTEVKTEVVIDRLTSAATPRDFERVPAGAKFDFEIVYNFYRDPEDFLWFKYLIAAMGLLEGDFLGGQGSRGYGQVKFENVQLTSDWFDGKEHAIEGVDITKSINPSEQLKTLWPEIAKERGLQP